MYLTYCVLQPIVKERSTQRRARPVHGEHRVVAVSESRDQNVMRVYSVGLAERTPADRSRLWSRTTVLRTPWPDDGRA